MRGGFALLVVTFSVGITPDVLLPVAEISTLCGLLNGRGTVKTRSANLDLFLNQEDYLRVQTSNPKFWAGVGFVFGVVLASGGEIQSPPDLLFGGVLQALIWFGISYVIIKRRTKKNE